jgi:hypothetical protein
VTKFSQLLSLCLLLLPLGVFAQTVSDIQSLSDGKTFTMKINGVAYTALTRSDIDALRKSIQERETLRKRLADTEEKLAALQAAGANLAQVTKDYDAMNGKLLVFADDNLKLEDKYSATANKLVELNRDYSLLVTDYDSLAKKYRDIATRAAPRQAIDIGAGMMHTNDKDRFVGMAGVGIGFGVRAWIFGGQDTYGAAVGYSF